VLDVDRLGAERYRVRVLVLEKGLALAARIQERGAAVTFSEKYCRKSAAPS
jgi:hypothetical protein